MIQSTGTIQSGHKKLIEIRGQKNLSSNEKILSLLIHDLKQGSQTFNKEEFEKIFIDIDKDFLFNYDSFFIYIKPFIGLPACIFSVIYFITIITNFSLSFFKGICTFVIRWYG